METEKSLETASTTPTLQRIEDITFEKVEGGDVNAENTLFITNSNGEQSEEELLDKAKRETLRLNWWLQKYWQEKGVPKQQISITIGDQVIELYNYGQPLSAEQIEELKKTLERLSRATIPNKFQKIQYVVIDNQDQLNDQNGENKRGYAHTTEKMITLYPRAVSSEGHRIANVSGFAGTIAHEFGHFYINVDIDFINEWREKFGWKLLPDDQIDKSKLIQKIYITTQPERCISSYAQYSPDEDICESLSAFINNPEGLDPEKLTFIKSCWFKDTPPSEQQISLSNKSGAEIKLPTIPKRIKYVAKIQKFYIN